jgi:hypothetical protein
MNVPAEERSSWQIICEDAAPRPAHRPRIWRDCEYIHRSIGAPCRDAIFLVGTSADSNPDDDEWCENQKDGWTGRYHDHVVTRLEADVFPELGSRPIAYENIRCVQSALTRRHNVR